MSAEGTGTPEDPIGWEEAFRSPAARPPAAPPPTVGGRAGRPADGGEGPPGPPAWGTPDSAPVRQGPTPVGQPAPADVRATRVPPAERRSVGVFRLLVEQNSGSGDSMKWRLEPEPGRVFETREEARGAALETCRKLSPNHPYSEQRRTVYRISADEYLVTVQGMTALFHFRVSVGEELP